MDRENNALSATIYMYIAVGLGTHAILHIVIEGFPPVLKASIGWCSEEHELICTYMYHVHRWVCP
jgi:hypothetical protein